MAQALEEEALWERARRIEEQVHHAHDAESLQALYHQLRTLTQEAETWVGADPLKRAWGHPFFAHIMRLRIEIERRLAQLGFVPAERAVQAQPHHPIIVGVAPRFPAAPLIERLPEVLQSPGGRSYRITKKLNTTLYGAAYLAQDMASGALVVIKISNLIPPRHLAHENPELEADLLHALRGTPEVIQLVDSWRQEGHLLVVLEYANRGELFDTVAQAPRPPTLREVRRWGLTIARALHALHVQGISHLDVSLENIFMNDPGNGEMEAKLGDFGMAQRALRFPPRPGAPGKPGYMAPEVLRGLQHEGPAVDIFALGVCLLMMITRQPLFSNQRNPLASPELRYVENGRLVDILNRRNVIRLLTPNAIDLIGRMLLPPNRRISLENVLAHPFWREQ